MAHYLFAGKPLYGHGAPLTDFAPSLRFVGPHDTGGASFLHPLPAWPDSMGTSS